MILGITGGSGCGKTTALEAVRDLGGLVLDCDAIYHDLLNRSPSLLAAIDRRFPGVVSQSGLDRKGGEGRGLGTADRPSTTPGRH